jgi:prephenate dehydrogenase
MSKLRLRKPTIAIIGYGDFTKLLIKHLHPYAKIVVHSRRQKPGARGQNCTFVDAKTALGQKTIIPSIPAQALEDYFRSNKEFINPQALVIDVCSVKVNPVKTLKKVLPKTCSILATHPMFGPESAKNGLKGLKIMMYPVRMELRQYGAIKRLLSKKFGLRIIECTLERHDKMMAYVQGLSHYIARVMDEMNIPETELSTLAYEDLIDMKRVQGGDSWELFYSIMEENPYTHKVNRDFKKACLNK